MVEEPSPVDRLIDLVVFAPLGLVLRARDELPRLAGYGRERFNAQAGVARMVGQMTVAQVRRKLDGVLAGPDSEQGEPAPAQEPSPAKPDTRQSEERTATEPARPAEAARADATVPVADHGTESNLPAIAPEAIAETSGPRPLAADLPIPGYDSLSASQVVQRLAGLSPDELEAVRAYEQAGRNRQTILMRVAQLRPPS